MISRATFLWMLLAVAAGLGLFVLKYEVHAMEERLVAIHRQTLQDLESIHVLKAEWNYLNQPARLEELGGRLLSLQSVTAAQSVSIDEIPLRPEGLGKPLPPAPIPSLDDLPLPMLTTFRETP